MPHSSILDRGGGLHWLRVCLPGRALDGADVHALQSFLDYMLGETEKLHSLVRR